MGFQIEAGYESDRPPLVVVGPYGKEIAFADYDSPIPGEECKELTTTKIHDPWGIMLQQEPDDGS